MIKVLFQYVSKEKCPILGPTLKNILKEMVAEAEENGWSSDIYVTGHGKGGAMASIASVFIRRSNSLPDPKYVW